MPITFISIAAGTDFSACVNIETLFASEYTVPNYMPDRLAPLTGPVGQRALSGDLYRVGKPIMRLPFDLTNYADKDALETALFGATYPPTAASVAVVLITLDERGYYSPFTAYADRPYVAQDFNLLPGGAALRMELPLFDLRLQYTTISSDTTITDSSRLVLIDTSGGNVTATLPAIADVAPYTPIRFHKYPSQSNTATLDGASSEQIDGASTKTVTSITQIYHNGTQWVSFSRAS